MRRVIRSRDPTDKSAIEETGQLDLLDVGNWAEDRTVKGSRLEIFLESQWQAGIAQRSTSQRNNIRSVS